MISDGDVERVTKAARGLLPALGSRLSDADTVAVVAGTAHRIGMKAYQLDWAIWEHSRGGLAGV